MDVKNEFRLYNKIIKYDEYIREYVANNIPSVHRDVRIHLLDESYNLIKYQFEAQFNKGNIRNKYINEMIVTISILDYLSNLLIKINKENKKHIITSIHYLTEIKNMTYAWRKNPEKES